MKKRLGKSIISIVLAIAVLVTSIPLMSWTAIAQTVVPAVTSAQDDSLAETSADVSAADTGDSNITVDYPISADNKNYVLDESGILDSQKEDYEFLKKYGLFDVVTYYMLTPTHFPAPDYCTISGNTVTLNVGSLFNHFIIHGKSEGRCTSPLFCIKCYLGENVDLYDAFTERQDPYSEAWGHITDLIKNNKTEIRYVSPVFIPAEYRNMYSYEAIGNYNLGECLFHFLHYNQQDMRQPRDDFNHIAYFYNNNSIFHSTGTIGCYRKRIKEITNTNLAVSSQAIRGGCPFHDPAGGTPFVYNENITKATPKTGYEGYADIDGGLKSDGTTNPNFTATITSIVNFKNIALNAEGNAAFADTPADSSNQKWYFEKQHDGAYTIRLAETSNNALTYENTDNTKKYLRIDDKKNLVVSETSMNWRIYKNDGAYVLHPITTSGGDVLNMADDGTLLITRYNNTLLGAENGNSYYVGTTQEQLHSYQNFTMNQQFILNTTNSTTADSDELPAHFFTNLGMFKTESSTSIDTSLALTVGNIHPRTRATDVGHYGADQEWCFDRQADGTYLISNTGNGLYLCYDSSVEKVWPTSQSWPTPPGVGSYEYYSALTKENDGSDIFKWILRKRDDGGYFIMPVASAARDRFWEGTFLQQAVDGNTGKEYLLYGDKFFEGSKVKYSVFDIQPKENDMQYAYIFNSTNNENKNFYATISSAKSEYKDFYIQNSTQEETAIVFKDTGNLKKHDFYWKFERRPDGTYIIYSTTTVGYCLTAKNNTLYLAKDSSTTAIDQLWYVFEYDGKFKIQHKRTGKVLQIDASGNPTFEFDNMNYSNDVQLFNIKETDMTINTVNENFKVNLFNYGTRINNTVDSKFVLDFVSGQNDARDKRNVSIGAGDGVIPEMSRVLDEKGYPYVKKYAYTAAEKKGIIGGAEKYDKPVNIGLTPNFETSGSLQYLFDVSSGFVRGGNDSPIDKYDTSVEYGDEYQSQAFKVTNPTGLFQKDSEGYYYYDSSKNSAYLDFDADNPINENRTLSGTIKLYDYLTHPHGVAPMQNPVYQGMFLPFNLAHEQGKVWYESNYYFTDAQTNNFHYNYKDWNDPALDKASYTVQLLERDVLETSPYTQTITRGEYAKAVDTWFGMTLETDFYHVEELNNKPVKFAFAGDDDVWVYIDGVLVLDIGDTHGKLEGTINFDDSTVTAPVKEEYNKVQYSDETYANVWGKNADGSYKLETKSIYSKYYNALEEVKDDAEKAAKIEATIRRSFVGLAEVETLPAPVSATNDPKLVQLEQHNLKFFYLERGSGASNCSIKLNTFSGGTTVSKEVTNLNEELAEVIDYKFKAVTVAENGNETPLANSPYTVSSTMSTFSNDDVATASELKTDENGCFTIKANQNAHLSKVVPGSTIKVYEIIDDVAAKTSWRTQVAGEDNHSGDGVETDPVKVPSDSTLEIIFKNDYEPSQDVIITKSLDKSNLGDNYRPNVNQTYDIGFEILDLNGNLVTRSKLSLHDDEIGTISDIPVGYTYRIWEYYPSNTKLNFEAPVFQKKGKEPETKMFVASGAAAPGTESYMQGKSVLGVNDEYTITNKLVDRNTISVTFKYYNRKRVDGAPAQINSYSTSYKKNLKAEEWDEYVDTETQRINFSKLIADQGILFNGTVGVDNIIDEYVVWTSQAEAEAGFAKETNYFADKDNGEYQKYGDTNPSELAYHTDAFGKIANDGEKWVTYYQGSKKIDPEIQGNDLDVTNITVWLFNKPKEYTATLHTIDPKNVTTAIYKSEKDILIGTDKIEFKAYYNQRIGNATDSESSESDAETLNKYLGVYKISDTDVVKGKNLNTGDTVDYVDMPQTVTRNNDANSEPYSFQYWSYDPEGQFVASTSINYAYRVTNDITLYAVYGKTGLQFPGLTSFKNGIDFYYNGSGVGQVRLNTMMNPYNCPDNDETITEAAIMYVMLHGSDEYKGKSQDELLKLLLKDSGNGYGMTNLDVLREDIRRILLQEKPKAVATQKTGQVTVIDVEITASGFKYYVENADGTDSSALNLTTKNRLQFTTEFTRDKLKGKHMLAFTAMKRNNSWIVSDNYVDYNFVNVFNFE